MKDIAQEKLSYNNRKNIIMKGGFPIGTIRNGYIKIKDTGGAGDWIKVTPELETKKETYQEIQGKESAKYVQEMEQTGELTQPQPKKEFEPSKYQQAIFDFVEFGEGNAVIDAVAGSGKTTTIVNALKKISPNLNTTFLAFNKSIVTELEKKTPSHVNVQTLHSLGWQGIRKRFGNDIKLDNYKVSKIIGVLEAGWEDAEKNSDYKIRVSKLVDLARNNLITNPNDHEALYELAEKHDIEIADKEVSRAFEVLNLVNGDRKTFDFCDMLYVAATDDSIKLPIYDWVMIDECQDLNKSQVKLFKKLLGPTSRFIAVGDPFQCQIEGTKVLCFGGEKKNIEDLKVGDKVVTFNSSGSIFRGLNDINFCDTIIGIGKREVEEKVIKITTETGKTSTYSNNHICLASLSKEAKNYQALYLMEDDFGRFRVGVCKLWYNSGVGFSSRVRSEGAKRAWILNVFKDKNEAFLAEQFYSIKYQIPDIIFNRESQKINTYNQEDLERLWNDFENNLDFYFNSRELLKEFGKFYEYPLYEKGSGKTKTSIGSGVITEIRACNLFPEVFHVICLDESRIEEEKNINRKINTINRENRYEQIINIEKILYKGVLYSLEIEKDKTYIADDIVTHNCIYGFTGADVDSFNNLVNTPNTTKLPLSVCYRCGKNIIDVAKTVVPHLEAREGAPDGVVDFQGTLSQIKSGDMVLCRNTAPLVKLCLSFIASGRKAYVKGSDIGKNLIGIIDKSKTDNLEDFTKYLTKEYGKILEQIARKEKGLSDQGIKEHPKARLFAEKMIILTTIANSKNEIRSTQDIKKEIENIFKDEEGGVCFSTIHKSKGLEADNVHIIEPGLMPSKYAKKDWQKVQEENLRYVAYTRAKKHLGIITDWEMRNKEHGVEYVRKKLLEKGEVIGEVKRGGEVLPWTGNNKLDNPFYG